MTRTLTLLLLLLPGALFAQPPGGLPDGPEGERLRAARVAFLTQRLALTAEESAAFWPVFNEFDAEREALLEERGELGALEVMSDAQLEETLLAEFRRQEAMAGLQRQYLDRFKAVLPARKAMLVFLLEHRFKEELLDRLRRRMGGPPAGGTPGGGARPGGPRR